MKSYNGADLSVCRLSNLSLGELDDSEQTKIAQRVPMDWFPGILTVLGTDWTHSHFSVSTHHVPLTGNVLFICPKLPTLPEHGCSPPLRENPFGALSVLTDISFLWSPKVLRYTSHNLDLNALLSWINGYVMTPSRMSSPCKQGSPHPTHLEKGWDTLGSSKNRPIERGADYWLYIGILRS